MKSDEKMPETLYDTRYFLEVYGAGDASLKRKIKADLETRRRRYVSAITIHEVYRVTLQDDGREIAKLRKAAIERDFKIIEIDSDIAMVSAEIKVAQGRNFPLADAIIAATAILRKLDCFTDDEHIKSVAGVKTRWF